MATVYSVDTTTNVSTTFTSMDSELGPSIFEEPVCLIESALDGKLIANEKAVRQLEMMTKTVKCVAVAGPYRTGKSYLLNRLAGRSSGFPLGATIESKTKGIWVWCIPHPCHQDQVLVLLDTEGLGDVAKGDQNHDNWIFALAVLLSSTLVYNTLTTIDQGAIEKLNFVTEISKHIKTKQHGSDSDNFDQYFPNFVFCLRDFYLMLQINGEDVTADEYLESALKYKDGSDEITIKYNEPRKCIRRYFKTRKCFAFDRPGNKEKLQKLEELTDSDLEVDFVAKGEEFCRYIYRECPPKKLDKNGTPVTGRMFASLVTSYVDAIRNGAVPCIENALNTMAELENTKAVEEGIKLYDDYMTKNLSLPTNLEDMLPQVHCKAIEESVSFFLKKSIYDTERKYQRKMNEQIMNKLIEWKKRNEQASVDKCNQVLQTLDTTIANKLENGVYMCTGGYAMYRQDLDRLQEEYDSTQGLGLKTKDTLLTFLKEKRTVAQNILLSDKKLSVEEKKLEEQRQKAHEAEREKQAAKREGALKEQHAIDVEKMMKENLQQIEKKNVEDLENLKKNNEAVICSRLKEQEKTLKEGFNKEASFLQSQLEVVRNRFTEEQGRLRDEAQALQYQITMGKLNEKALSLKVEEQQNRSLQDSADLQSQIDDTKRNERFLRGMLTEQQRKLKQGFSNQFTALQTEMRMSKQKEVALQKQLIEQQNRSKQEAEALQSLMQQCEDQKELQSSIDRLRSDNSGKSSGPPCVLI